jgi:YidC/Oxa1 family membrane protein insertase
MDRKSIIVLVACMGLLLLLQTVIVPKFFPPIPLPKTNTLVTATNGVMTNAALIPAAITTNGAPAIAAPAPAIAIATNVVEVTETLETTEASLAFTSHGGGVKQVALKGYHETVGCDVIRGTNLLATLNDHARIPVGALQAGDLFGDNIFKLTVTSKTSLTAEKTLASGLRVVKRFDLGSNFQSTVTVTIENPTAQSVALPEQHLSVGTATPMGPRDNMQMMGVFWFNGLKPEHIEHAYFEGTGGCVRKHVPRLTYSEGSNNVLWAAVHNQFFAIVVVPSTNSTAGRFTTHRINLTPPTAQEIAADSKLVREPHGLEATISYPAVTLAPKQSLERQYTIYAGPKQEKLLSSVGRQTGSIMDFGFWGFISKLMLRVMNGIHGVIAPIIPDKLGDYAMSLVIMTIIIKLLFWPLTQKSTQSMKRMQALSPEMKKIQEKYKDDPMKMNKKVMEFWREHKVSPMSGCWPMMIQLPIFFALFRMIPNAIELRGTPFLWACDLSKPDTIWMLPWLNYPLNPLPLLMGVTMLIQARLQPPSPGMDPAQQTMMKYMPLMFMVFLYNQPAGLTLYWTVQNLLTIVQTKLTKAKAEPKAPAPVTQIKKKK